MSMSSGLSPSGAYTDIELTAAQFARITTLLFDHAGIRMREGKEGLVRARLAKRVRALRLADFDAYLTLVQSESSKSEFVEMIDALTTNKTSFLREASHFEFLRDHVLPALHGDVRIWSAGCSTGEEAYTLAMLLLDAYPDAVRRAKILATDINHHVLAHAKSGRYSTDVMSDVPARWLQKYWTHDNAADGGIGYMAKPNLGALIHFGKLNLMQRWPMKGPFDAILCRNVMIYFEKATQQQLIQRYWELLRPGGYLFVGHSESLTGLSHQFRYVQPAVYVK